MAGADKFGNVYFVRLPQDVSDEIEEDPTGGKLSGSRESLMELQTRRWRMHHVRDSDGEHGGPTSIHLSR
ncbi:hypothetical protein OIU77_021053 [Salix suchowensis]|uniref:Uncharacterized protein n=1 Tax=Salix suchowensis TaxID=1278906 RepID=A0ABQ9C8I3_9ROSI|nr:hypothetical protein OIU77_021053 [Salix suchowensis]